jgi:hypothetical protein
MSSLAALCRRKPLFSVNIPGFFRSLPKLISLHCPNGNNLQQTKSLFLLKLFFGSIKIQSSCTQWQKKNKPVVQTSQGFFKFLPKISNHLCINLMGNNHLRTKAPLLNIQQQCKRLLQKSNPKPLLPSPFKGSSRKKK